MRGRSGKPVLIGLGLVMLMGISVYLRLWTIDYRISSEDTDLIRWVPFFYIFFSTHVVFLYQIL